MNQHIKNERITNDNKNTKDNKENVQSSDNNFSRGMTNSNMTQQSGGMQRLDSNVRDMRIDKNQIYTLDSQDIRNERYGRDNRDPRDNINHIDSLGMRDSRDPRDMRDLRDIRDGRDFRDPRDFRDSRDDPNYQRDSRNMIDPYARDDYARDAYQSRDPYYRDTARETFREFRDPRDMAYDNDAFSRPTRDSRSMSDRDMDTYRMGYPAFQDKEDGKDSIVRDAYAREMLMKEAIWRDAKEREMRDMMWQEARENYMRDAYQNRDYRDNFNARDAYNYNRDSNTYPMQQLDRNDLWNPTGSREVFARDPNREIIDISQKEKEPSLLTSNIKLRESIKEREITLDKENSIETKSKKVFSKSKANVTPVSKKENDSNSKYKYDRKQKMNKNFNDLSENLMYTAVSRIYYIPQTTMTLIIRN